MKRRKPEGEYFNLHYSQNFLYFSTTATNLVYGFLSFYRSYTRDNTKATMHRRKRYKKYQNYGIMSP